MIHTARQTGKFIKFVRKLRPMVAGCPVDVETVAVGLLERLWHLAISCAKRGDIGKLDNETIAEAMGWHGEAAVIIDLLVSLGWLDECAECRLVIHDWEEHVPTFVKRNIGKQGGFVVAKKGLDDSPDAGSDSLTHQGSGQALTPNLTKHNITIDRSISDRSKIGEATDFAFADDWWAENRERANEVMRAVQGDQRKPPSAEDRTLAVFAVACETQLAIGLDAILDGLRRRRKTESVPRPWGYVRSSLINACEGAGQDFHALFGAFRVPKKITRKVPAQGASP